jgi:hypothetical protein
MKGNIGFAALALIVLMAGSARADRSAPDSTPSLPPGWMAVNEAYWDVLLDGTQDHLFRAKDDFADMEVRQAADEMIRAVAFMRIEESRASERSAKELEKAADRVQKLAADLESRSPGGSVDQAKLQSTFAQACHVLARHYHDLALEAKQAQDRRRYGTTLHATADYLAYTNFWANGTIDMNVINRVRAAAARILAGSGPLRESEAEDDDVADLQHELTNIDTYLIRQEMDEPGLPEKNPVR